MLKIILCARRKRRQLGGKETKKQDKREGKKNKIRRRNAKGKKLTY
jgi:hypothetical protein